MISENACVRHSVLALASLYILDFVPEKKIQDRANSHIKKAAELLSAGLEDPDRHLPGKEESLVASLMLLIADDIINWETRKRIGMDPNWWVAAKTARRILDHSDPGYRYTTAQNVQASSARVSLSNWIAFIHILAEPVLPLQSNSDGRIYPWLIHGNKHESRKIHGATGTSPKLLHIFAQITHLTSGLLQVSRRDPTHYSE